MNLVIEEPQEVTRLRHVRGTGSARVGDRVRVGHGVVGQRLRRGRRAVGLGGGDDHLRPQRWIIQERLYSLHYRSTLVATRILHRRQFIL